MLKKIFLQVFFLTLTIITKSLSQEDFDNTFYTSMVKSFNCQVVTFGVPNKDSVDAIIAYKFSPSNLTFERISSSTHNLLRGIAFIEVIFRDEIGIIRKIVTKVDTLYKEGDFTSLSYLSDEVGSLFVCIPKGNYQVEVSLYDKKIIKQKSIKIDLKLLKLASFSISTMIFAPKQNSHTYIIEPKNFIDFKNRNKTILFGLTSKEKPNKINYIVKSFGDRTERLVWARDISFSGSLQELKGKFEFDSINLRLSIVDDTQPNVYFFELNIPEHFAYPQRYTCYLFTEDNIRDTLTFDFQIKWDQTPLSLRNIQYAIDLMYYILTDKEFEILKSYKKNELSTKFFETWKRFDTDTTTLFNEAMEEYYNRVDFAYFNYQTINEPDGAKTDRGKIFILFGKPSSISRELDKNGMIREIWRYPTIHQTFVFVSQDGNLILKEISKD